MVYNMFYNWIIHILNLIKVMGGDYNNVELREDQSQGYSDSTMGGRECNK
jgi:hypothetical protein